jgi:DNA-directed RNA polymerase specialized sigma24 family protein
MPYWELEQIAEWAEELPAEMRVPVYQMEPALLGQVWAEQVLALMAERCTSREWETIERVVVQGQAIKEAAAEMGVGIAAVCMSLRRAGRRVEAVLR